MNTKRFISLALKLYGVYFFIQIATLIPQIITLIGMGFFNSIGFKTIEISAISILSIMGMYFVLGWLLTLKSDRITDFFIKESDNVEFTLNMHRSTVLSIAIILIGGVMVINEIPNLISQLSNQYGQLQINNQSGFLIASLIKIGIGSFLIAYTNRIVCWIEKKRKK